MTNEGLNRFLAAILSVGLAWGLGLIWLWPILAADPHSFIGCGGDSIKNAHTFIYFLTYDQGYLHFTGSRYPYGEHILFTDAQPALVWALRPIQDQFGFSADFWLQILKLALWLGIGLSAFAYFKLLAFYNNVNLFFAALVSAALALLTPQLDRIAGHFALSYGFFIPFSAFFLAQYDQNPTFKNALKITAVILIAAFVHLYFVGIILFILIGYWAYWAFRLRLHTPPLKIFRQIGHAGLMTLVPALAPLALLALTDSITDRPNRPYGFLYSLNQWYLTFWTPQLGFDSIPNNSTTYVGFAACLFGIPAIFQIVINRRQFSGAFWGLVIAGLIALFFSMGWPFVFGLEYLIDWLGPFQQFRYINRFGWVFFVALHLLVFIGLNFWAKNIGEIGKTFILALYLFFIFHDAYLNAHPKVPYQTRSIPDIQTGGQLLNSVKKIGFQAIIPLPGYYIGAENALYSNRYEELTAASILSVFSGIPTTSFALSRTSFRQTLKSLQFSLQATAKPTSIIQDASPIIKDRRPFLLLYTGKPLAPFEKTLYRLSSALDKKDTIELRILPYDSFYVAPKRMAEWQIETFKTKQKQVPLKITGGFLSSFDILFPDSIKERSLPNGDPSEWTRGLIEINQPEIYTPVYAFSRALDKPFVVSFWAEINKPEYFDTQLIVEAFDSTGASVYFKNVSIMTHLAGIDENWGLIEYRLDPVKGATKYQAHLHDYSLKPKKNFRQKLTKALVRYADDTVYCPTDSGVWANYRFCPY